MDSNTLDQNLVKFPPKGIKQLSPEQKREIVSLYAAGEKTNEIMRTYNLRQTSIVSLLAKAAGIPLRRPGTTRLHRKRSLSALAPDIDQLLSEAKAKVAELEYLKKSKSIRFELQDNSTVIIYNVDPNFIKLEGMVRLREFIQKSIPQRR